MLRRNLAFIALVVGLVESLVFGQAGLSSQLQTPSSESTVKVQLYAESLGTVLTFLCSKEKVTISDELSMPGFDVATLAEPDLHQLRTGSDSDLSVLVLLKQLNAQKTLVLTKSQVKPEYRIEAVQVPKRVWVKGHSRRGTYVKPYRRKDGTYVRGHYRKGTWVKGHWRTVGTETVTRTTKKYPYGLTSELLNDSVFGVLDSRYRSEKPDQEIQSQMESLRNTLKELENTKEVEEQ